MSGPKTVLVKGGGQEGYITFDAKGVMITAAPESSSLQVWLDALAEVVAEALAEDRAKLEAVTGWAAEKFQPCSVPDDCADCYFWYSLDATLGGSE